MDTAAVPPSIPLPELAKLVEQTNLALGKARDRATDARRAETDALNAANAAQQAFDIAVADMRKNAFSGTDWNTPTGHTKR